MLTLQIHHFPEPEVYYPAQTVWQHSVIYNNNKQDAK